MNTSLFDKIAVTVAVAMQHKGPNERHNGRVVEKVTRDILEAVREELPPLVDVDAKWELPPEEIDDAGVTVTITNNRKRDGEQLMYLSRFATDQGYNAAILKMHEDLYVPENSVMIER